MYSDKNIQPQITSLVIGRGDGPGGGPTGQEGLAGRVGVLRSDKESTTMDCLQIGFTEVKKKNLERKEIANNRTHRRVSGLIG